jgi:hypothetical protein
MELLLKSSDQYKIIGLLNLETRVLREVARRPDTGSANGFFSRAVGVRVAIYHTGQGLELMIDSLVISMDSSIEFILTPIDDSKSRVILKSDTKIHFDSTYIRPILDIPLSLIQHVNPFASEEDEDIFLFAHNIWNKKERLANVLKRWDPYQ